MRYFLALLCLLAIGGYVWSVETRIPKPTHAEVRDVKTIWMSGGVRQEVNTRRAEGEDVTTFQDRHFAAVRAAQADFPPDAA